MAHKKDNFKRGVTLIELMITVLAVMILVVGISGILAMGHRNYNTMYERVNSEVVRNAYEARRTFDRIVRKSIREHEDLDPVNYDDIYVYYYSDPQNMSKYAYPDKYAWFHLANIDDEPDMELVMDTGDLVLDTTVDPWEWNISSGNPSSSIMAHNVNSVKFTIRGASVRMALVLDNENPPNTPQNKLETLKMTVTTTAIRHNKLPEQ